MHNSMKPLTDLRASPRRSAFSLSLSPSPPTNLSRSRFPLGPTESDRGKQSAQVHHRSVRSFTAGFFLTWMSAIPHILEPKTANHAEEIGREILKIEKWRKVGVLSFDPINLSDTKTLFVPCKFLRVIHETWKAKKDTLHNIYSVT